jgi:hypothetical protein
MVARAGSSPTARHVMVRTGYRRESGGQPRLVVRRATTAPSLANLARANPTRAASPRHEPDQPAGPPAPPKSGICSPDRSISGSIPM